MEYKTVMMRPEDNVATALMTIPEGSRLIVECRGIRHEITLLQTVEFGHKFAVRPIAEGEDIVKYGEVIGVAQPGHSIRGTCAHSQSGRQKGPGR